MRAAFLALALACLASAAGGAAQPRLVFNLRVTVEGVQAGGGTLRIALHDEATFADARAVPLRRQDIASVAGNVAVPFDRLPPGSYAVRAFQDLNNDGKIDAGEPQGISNDAPSGDFEKAAVDLMPGNTAVTLRLK